MMTFVPGLKSDVLFMIILAFGLKVVIPVELDGSIVLDPIFWSPKEYTDDITGSESSVFSTSFKVVVLNDVTWLIVGNCNVSSLIGFVTSSCRKMVSFSTVKPMWAKTVASTCDAFMFYYK